MILKFIGGPDDGGEVEIDDEELRDASFVMVAVPTLWAMENESDAPSPNPAHKNGIARYRKGEIGDLIFDGYE